MANETSFKKTILLGLIVVFAILSFMVARPFILTIISSMILAYILNPLDNQLKKIVKNANISAGIISVVIFIALILAVGFLTPILVRQAFTIYTDVQNIDFVAPLRKIAPTFFSSPEFTRDFTVTINALVIKIADSVMARFEEIISNLPSIFTHIVVLFFVFFFTLRDEDKIIKFLKDMSPFKEETEKKFVSNFHNITRSVLYGLVIIGTIQGIVAGFGFYAFRIPHALLLTLIAILFGILPILGPFMLWLPIGVGILVNGNVSIGLLFILYNIITTGIISFFIGPRIVGRMAKIPEVIALIGMLGGGYLFGIIGVILGPLILGYLILFLEFFRNKKVEELFSWGK